MKLVLVNESLALAMQFCSIPPFCSKNFLGVDFGSSKLTVSLYSLEQVVDGEETGKEDGGARRPTAYCLREVGSRTNVFVGGSQVEYRMIQWVRRRHFVFLCCTVVRCICLCARWWVQCQGRRRGVRRMAADGGGRRRMAAEGRGWRRKAADGGTRQGRLTRRPCPLT